MNPVRQHLIDPEVCIRCNTCEATCPIDAISHDDNNYVVDVAKCGMCLDCISPCPTGAIDNWRTVLEPYSLQDQYSWEELPEQSESVVDVDHETAAAALETEPGELIEVATAGQGGLVPAPVSASKPCINIFTREAPATAKVVGNFRLTAEGTESDIRHIVLDFSTTAFPVLEGQSIGIIPPGTDEQGRPHHVRLYSVASPRDGERPNHNNLSLSVKRVNHDHEGKPQDGACSNYVCDLKMGDKVQVTGPFGSTFLMPNDPQANLIMICTGTGAAPFRAMTEYRRRHAPNTEGQMMLFIGARTPDELPYHGPLAKLKKEFIDTQMVFSRLPGKPKEYVQDRMRTRADAIVRLLKSQDTYVFICGLKGMENGVADSFVSICQGHGLDWEKLRADMRASGRYHVETY